ncbi:MAG: type II toxin-antitoxin system Phd/YefM family antitoxin [Synergistaceae bacterium]|nr:type II toxin-antitoxin system Phd/YefM family antitoxin [Synergistaceae bacterium]
MRVTYEEFKDNLPELMGRVQFGDEHQIIITKNGVPVAKLVDYYNPPRGGVKLGVADGKFIIPDDFDSMMSDEIAEMFGVK